MENQNVPIIVQPGAGKDLHAFGNVLSVLIGGEQTGGSLAVMSEATPPGGGPPLHVHSAEDELFLVAEGQISYFVNGQWIEVGVGGAVYLPRGAAHCYRNIGAMTSRHWIITLPAGFEDFFADSAVEFAKSSAPEPQRIVDIHHRHGIELLETPPQ
ncbi:MAG TPA: cupin domain-containing protein [Anaerolineaceae bacterium]